MKKMRLWVVLTISFMSVMSIKAQGQRWNEFVNEFSKYQTEYIDLMQNGKHKEALAPLASGITLQSHTTARRSERISTMRRSDPWLGRAASFMEVAAKLASSALVASMRPHTATGPCWIR